MDRERIQELTERGSEPFAERTPGSRKLFERDAESGRRRDVCAPCAWSTASSCSSSIRGSDELRAFIEERTRNRPDLVEANRRRAEPRYRLGPLSFGPDHIRELPIEPDTFALLRDMLDHLVSRRLPPHAVEALRAALGDGLRPPRS